MNDLDKHYYKIKDVSELLGIPTSALRYWEKEFPQCAPRRSATNIRYYTPENIETLRIINYLLKVKGLKIEAAKEQLRTNKSNISKRVNIIESLTKTRNDLQKLLSSLNKRR